MSTTYGVAAIALVAVATLGIGAFGLRVSRTPSDFYVASRSVSPLWNSSAIGGEYLSAASFLGVAGLVLASGADMLWFPIGWTGGYLVLLAFVAAPLRRSGAYTIPDFAQLRLGSNVVRRTASILVIAVGWLYLMPQFQGAGLTMRTVTGAPGWVGTVVVAVVVVLNVAAGGMRSITFVQAFQYWLKLAALLVPVFFLLHAWTDDGRPSPVAADDWFRPFGGSDAISVYLTYSVLAATLLGTMGLPHVVVRFYTNPDGRAARRTTVIVLGLLGAFYLLPTVYGVLGRIYASDLVGSGRTDAVVLELPARVLGGATGELLAALLTAGAFAAFLSTSSGLTMSIAGAVGQGLAGRRGSPRIGAVAAVRIGAVVAVLVPMVLALSAERVPVASSVTFAFALAASTFCPLLVLGVWWRGLTDAGAVAGLVGGGVSAGLAPLLTLVTRPDGWTGALLGQPALWTVPIGFALMIGVSLTTSQRRPADVSRQLARLHAPEALRVE